MPTRKEVSKLKADFITTREKLIRGNISSYQLDLYDKLVEKYLSEIQGKKLNSSQTLSVVNDLEKVVKTYSVEVNTKILKEYISTSRVLGDLNMSYFATMFNDPDRLDLIRQKTNKVLNKKLGILDDGSIKAGGFLDKMISDPVIQKNIMKEVRKAITNNYDQQKLKEVFKRIIVGSPESTGVFERHFNTFAKDILNNIDNGNSKVYADELGLKHAYYAGGLIKTSRGMCIKNNGKIFTYEEIDNFRNNPFIVKMYGSNIDEYDPFTQPGGYGCLHSLDWITEDLALGNMDDQNAKAEERNQKFKMKNKL